MRETVLAVSRMQRYIEEHLDERINLRTLADVAGYSPFYSARIFKELTGRTPLSYVRELRLSVAALQLRDRPIRVLDVALDYAFGSHEGFTRAFFRTFGIAPQAYSQKKPPIPLFLPYDVLEQDAFRQKQEEDLRKMEKPTFKPIFVQVMERPARKALIKRGLKAEDYFSYCAETGCDVWGLLASVKEALYEPIGMWLPEKLIPKGTSRYVQGVEVPETYDNEIPAGYELIALESCKVMMFQGPKYEDIHFAQEVQAVMEYMEQFDPAPYGYAWADEDAPRFQLQPMGERGYMEARPVKPLVC